MIDVRSEAYDLDAFDPAQLLAVGVDRGRILRALGNQITTATIVLVALLLVSGSQFTLFAMWFDMESNKDLR